MHTISSSLLRSVVDPEGGRLLSTQFLLRDEFVDVAQNGVGKHEVRPAMLIMSPWTARMESKTFPFDSVSGLKVGASSVQLEAPWHPHAIHGFGWKRSWQVTEVSENAIHLELLSASEHGFSYPSDLKLRTSYRIDASTLHVTHSIENVGSALAPTAGGSHGFFAKYPCGAMRRPELQFRAKRMFQRRADLPTESMPDGVMIQIPEEDNFENSRIPDDKYDHCYDGWDGVAQVRWVELGLSLTVRDISKYPTDKLHLWFDKPHGTFALEPVIAPGNAFNLEAQGVPCGVRILKPGEKSEFTHTYSWEAF